MEILGGEWLLAWKLVGSVTERACLEKGGGSCMDGLLCAYWDDEVDGVDPHWDMYSWRMVAGQKSRRINMPLYI